MGQIRGGNCVLNVIFSHEIVSNTRKYDRMKESQMSKMTMKEILKIGIEEVTKETSKQLVTFGMC